MEQKQRGRPKVLHKKRSRAEVSVALAKYREERQLRPEDLELIKRSLLLEKVNARGFTQYMHRLKFRLEEKKLDQVLQECGGICQAARIMKMDRSNLKRLMKQHGK